MVINLLLIMKMNYCITTVFKVNKEIGSGKEVINVKVNFTNKSYSCKYTMAQ